MDNEFDLPPEDAKTYSTILDIAAQLPKNDPRYVFVICFSWFLLSRRRRLELQRIKRRQFYRRWRRIFLLRMQLQKQIITKMLSMKARELAASEQNESMLGRRLSTMSSRTNTTTTTNATSSKRENMTENLWTRMESGQLTDSEFLQIFHITKGTFDFIYSELEENLAKLCNNANATSSKEPSLNGKKRLAVVLHRLATNAEYLHIANAFGIGKSTSLIRDVCELIVSTLKNKYLNFSPGTPESKEELARRVRESEKEFDIANSIGILGSSDFLIVGPSWNLSEASPYTSIYSKNYALVFQTVVNHQGQFVHVCAGLPSGFPNSLVLTKSKLQDVMGEKFKGLEQSIQDNVKVPVVCIGYDSSFSPSQDWLVTAYEGEELEGTDEDREVKEKFNDKIHRAKNTFDDAILKLRSRFKILHGNKGKVCFSDEKTFENIANTCCILHNICQLRNDPLKMEWTEGINDQLFIRSSQETSFYQALGMGTEIQHGLQEQLRENQLLQGDDEDDDGDERMQEDIAENVRLASAQIRNFFQNSISNDLL